MDLAPQHRDALIQGLLGALKEANAALDAIPVREREARLFDLVAVLRARTAQVIKSNATHDAKYVGDRNSTPTRKLLGRLASLIRATSTSSPLDRLSATIAQYPEPHRERIAVQLATTLGFVAKVSHDRMRELAVALGWAPETGWPFQWLPPAISTHEPAFEGYVMQDVMATRRYDPSPLALILRAGLRAALDDSNAADACLAWLETYGASVPEADWRQKLKLGAHGGPSVHAIAAHLPNAAAGWEARALRVIAQLGYEESALARSLRFAPRDAARALLQTLPEDTHVALRGWLLVAAEQPDGLLELGAEKGSWRDVRWRAFAMAMTGQTKEALTLVEEAPVTDPPAEARRELLHGLYLCEGRGEDALRHQPIQDFSLPALQALAEQHGLSVMRVFQIGIAKFTWFSDRRAVYTALALGLEEEALRVAPTRSATPIALADLIASAPVPTQYEARIGQTESYHWLIFDPTIRDAIDEHPGVVMRFAVQAVHELIHAWRRESHADSPAARMRYRDMLDLVGKVLRIGERAAALADRVEEWTKYVDAWVSPDDPKELRDVLESESTEDAPRPSEEQAVDEPEIAEPDKSTTKTIGIGVRRRRRRK